MSNGENFAIKISVTKGDKSHSTCFCPKLCFATCFGKSLEHSFWKMPLTVCTCLSASFMQYFTPAPFNAMRNNDSLNSKSNNGIPGSSFVPMGNKSGADGRRRRGTSWCWFGDSFYSLLGARTNLLSTLCAYIKKSVYALCMDCFGGSFLLLFVTQTCYMYKIIGVSFQNGWNTTTSWCVSVFFGAWWKGCHRIKHRLFLKS